MMHDLIPYAENEDDHPYDAAFEKKIYQVGNK